MPDTPSLTPGCTGLHNGNFQDDTAVRPGGPHISMDDFFGKLIPANGVKVHPRSDRRLILRPA